MKYDFDVAVLGLFCLINKWVNNEILYVSSMTIFFLSIIYHVN